MPLRPSSWRRRFAFPAVIAAAVVLFSSLALGRHPSYLYVDEVVFALQAHSIITTGHDTSGRLLPVYFQMSQIAAESWFHPAIVYFMAPFLAVLPLSEAVIRFPSVILGAVDVFLIYFVARRVFHGRWQAAFAATLLAITPAHIIHSRMAMDYLYPLPFVLGWLLCLLTYVERRRSWLLFAAGALLGIGFYSYIAAVVMMPVYLLFTIAVLHATAVRPLRVWLLPIAGFGVPVTVGAGWLAAHPEMIAGTLARYAITPGTGTGISFSTITQRISVYWSLFDPGFLFVSGGYTHMFNTTRRVGVFLLPVAVFLPVGLIRFAAHRRSVIDTVFVAGFISAPLAACLLPEPYAIDRALVMLPFAAVLATAGVESLIAKHARRLRLLTAALLAVLVLHFAFFCYDYATDYPIRAAYRFQGNRRAALETIIERSPVTAPPAIYLSAQRIPYIGAHWELYLLKHGRQDLLARTSFFDSRVLDTATVPAGSMLLTTVDDAPAQAAVEANALELIATFPEPGNPPLFMLLRK